MTGAWSRESRYRLDLVSDGVRKVCASVKMTSSNLSTTLSNGDGGNGGKPSVSSGLDDCGDGGRGPNIFCDKSISFALSDLWTPARKPTGRRWGGIMSTRPTMGMSPRNSALMLFSICRSGAPR